MDNNINVYVIGSLHHNTLGVIRSLGEAGIDSKHIRVLIVAKDHNEKNLITSSKYVSTNNVSFVNEYSEIVPYLLRNSRSLQQHVVICCSDGAAGAVIKERQKLESKFKTPDSLIDISKLMIKSIQSEYAEKCGLTIPKSGEYNTNSIISWDSFPCIVKPYKSAMAAGKADIHIAYTQAELKQIIKGLKSERIQIQQYIDKALEFQLVGCSLDKGNQIIIPGYTNIIRQPKTTNTGYLLYSPIDGFEYDRENVKKFIRTIGYSGLFSVEFIRGKDGRDYFLEINMRNDGNAYCVKSAGVNLPYIWAYYQAFGKIPDVPLSFTEPIYFIPDLNDLKIAYKEVGIIKWIKQFKEAQSHSIFNRDDMGPFRYEIFRQLKRFVSIRK